MPPSTPESATTSDARQDMKKDYVREAEPYACSIAIDLEFTPVPWGLMHKTGLGYEIIEVGAVKVAPDGTFCGEFNRMVRPTFARHVAGWIHRMTGIGNEDLARAKHLDEVLDDFADWIGPGRVRMITWSNADFKQITDECQVKGIEHRLPSRWVDIQHLYPRLMGLPRHCTVALVDAAEWLGIDSDESSAHRALYDAQMTAEIFRMMAAGECKEHRSRLRTELGHEDAPCSASIGSQCDGLAELLAQLKDQEE